MGERISYAAYEAGVRYLFGAYGIRKVTRRVFWVESATVKLFERLGSVIKSVRAKQEMAVSKKVGQFIFGKFND